MSFAQEAFKPCVRRGKLLNSLQSYPLLKVIKTINSIVQRQSIKLWCVEPIRQITLNLLNVLVVIRGFRVLRGSALLAGSHLKFGHHQPIAKAIAPTVVLRSLLFVYRFRGEGHSALPAVLAE